MIGEWIQPVTAQVIMILFDFLFIGCLAPHFNNTIGSSDFGGDLPESEIGADDLRIGGQIGRSALQGDAPLLKHISAVRDGQRAARILLHKDDRDAAAPHCGDDLENLLRYYWRETD